ncbi:MAG: hypothetical protein JW774_00310 [Candidatus Aureabacteria bacterium]|nr:hypothetical protein [Candidatus Auribacterota bacterium]
MKMISEQKQYAGAHLIILGMLIFLYAFSLFKNISYPLLWNDEAETAVYAERILDFGYPRVHDGKNALNLFSSNMDMALKEPYDAYIGSVWGQYYFCVPGAWLARKTDDLYLKSALMRIPFALAGMIGVFLSAGLVISFYTGKMAKLRYMILFLLMELVSVVLILYLREVRYYSLLIFLTSGVLCLYTAWKFHKRISDRNYSILMVFFLFLLFNVFHPVMIGLVCFLTAYEIIGWFWVRLSKQSEPAGENGGSLKALFRALLPMMVAFVLILPLVHFFEMVKLSAYYSSMRGYSWLKYFNHIRIIWIFYLQNDLLLPVLLIKALLVFLRLSNRSLLKNMPVMLLQCKYSDFLFFFFISMVLFIARIPLLWERYYVWMHPFWMAMFILDLTLIVDLLKANGLWGERRIKMQVILLIVILCGHVAWEKRWIVRAHLYELFHQYKGPLDFVIPYLRDHYPHPEQLVIATNYEEPSYMYYLRCKVTVGFTRNNIEEDRKISPDIIIYRKNWNGLQADILSELYQQGRFNRVSFPVFDYPVNNIPETKMHLYKTGLSSNEEDCAQILEKIRT